MHLILCIWLPFYRPCSFASQTFIWFADFLIIALILCKKLILLYFNAQLYTRKIYRFNARKTKKNSRYIYPNCSSTSEVHAALTLLFPAHLYSDCSISLELLSVFLSDSLNYLPEKTVIMSRLMLYIFFQVWSATAGFPAPWFFPVTTGKFPTVAIICIYWYHAFHIEMLFYPQYTSLSTSNYSSFPLLHVLIAPVIAEKY